MKITSILTILFLPIFLFAQASEPSALKEQKLFFDADAGAYLLLSDGGDATVQLSLNGGYLLSKQFGVGLESKYFGKSGTYASHSATGLGGFVKYEYKGFYLKPSFGKILYGSYGSDYAENERAEYKSASSYFSGTVGYRLKNGLLLGINSSLSNRVTFAHYVTDDPYTSTNDPLIYQGELKDKFGTFCLVVGYTWPKIKR